MKQGFRRAWGAGSERRRIGKAELQEVRLYGSSREAACCLSLGNWVGARIGESLGPVGFVPYVRTKHAADWDIRTSLHGYMRGGQSQLEVQVGTSVQACKAILACSRAWPTLHWHSFFSNNREVA